MQVHPELTEAGESMKPLVHMHFLLIEVDVSMACGKASKSAGNCIAEAQLCMGVMRGQFRSFKGMDAEEELRLDHRTTFRCIKLY